MIHEQSCFAARFPALGLGTYSPSISISSKLHVYEPEALYVVCQSQTNIYPGEPAITIIIPRDIPCFEFED
jgi:hypothetical protein